MKDINWFKKKIASSFDKYELNYRYFENGDLGSLNQVEFNSKKIDGAIDFWGQGWIGIHVWDNINERELLNVLLESNEINNIKKAFDSLKSLI